MIRFLNSPSEALGEALLEKNIMAFKVAREGLRLYPSTKRVYRKFQLEGETETKEYTADVEACHHDRAVWGEDAEQFKPERAAGLEGTNRHAWLPFGAFPFLCPARKDFALRIICVLVGGLCAEIDLAKWKVDLGADQQRYDEGGSLPSNRFSARDWKLKHDGRVF